jgi:hypothetical protein
MIHEVLRQLSQWKLAVVDVVVGELSYLMSFATPYEQREHAEVSGSDAFNTDCGTARVLSEDL